MQPAAFPRSMAGPEIVVLIPESTRKASGGSSDGPEVDAISAALPATVRAKLDELREEVLLKSPKGSVRPGGLLPACRRFQGNMYRNIPANASAGSSNWEPCRAPVIGVFGLEGRLRPVGGSRLARPEETE